MRVTWSNRTDPILILRTHDWLRIRRRFWPRGEGYYGMSDHPRLASSLARSALVSCKAPVIVCSRSNRWRVSASSPCRVLFRTPLLAGYSFSRRRVEGCLALRHRCRGRCVDDVLAPGLPLWSALSNLAKHWRPLKQVVILRVHIGDIGFAWM